MNTAVTRGGDDVHHKEQSPPKMIQKNPEKEIWVE